MWFDQAANAQSQGIQGAMLQQAIQAGQAQNAINEARDKSAAAIKEAQTQGVGALQAGQTGALGGLENYYNQAVGFQNPYLTAGAGATNQLAALYGPGGEYTKMPTFEQLQMDPSYAWRTQQGQQVLLNATRAGVGGANVGSGAAGKAFINYGQNAASQEYSNAYNRFMANRAQAVQALQGLSGQGASAANVASGLAGQTGANIGNVYTGTGQNLANVYGTTGTNLANVYTGAGNQLAANYNALGQNIGQGLVNQGAANASSYTNSANLLASLLGQGAQAAAYMYGRNPAVKPS